MMFLLPHILDWIYSKGFDEDTIPDEVMEFTFYSVATALCRNVGNAGNPNGRVWSLCDQ